MIPELIKLKNLSGIEDGGRPVVDIPRSGIYHGLFLVCRKAASALMTEAEIETDISNIRIRIDGDQKFDLTAAVLFDLHRYWFAKYGAYTIAGQIPIWLTRPHLQFAAERSLLAWGTKDVNSFTLEMDLAASLSALVTVELWAMVESGSRELGRHLCVSKNPRSYAGTGIHQVSDMDYGDPDNLILVDHITEGSGTIDDVTVRLNKSDVNQEVPAALVAMLGRDVGRTVQSGYYSVDYAVFNDRAGYLPSGGLSNLQYDINFSVQPDNFIIYREEIRGALKPIQ